MTESNQERTISFKAVGLVYIGLLIVHLLAAFYPEHRIWSLNLWGYYGASLPWILFGLGGVVLLGAALLNRSGYLSDDAADLGDTLFWIIAGALAAATTLLFYLWRARTHFLGDGYTVLSLLADPEPLIKMRELGEAMAHIWVKELFGSGESAALKSFQTVSIAAGAAFLISVSLFARALFERNRDRLLFLAGLASCGFVYNFFGYVENYSLFAFAVTLFGLTGLLVARDRASRWVILPMAALAVLFHIFGVALIPAALYLLLAGTKLSDRLERWSFKTKLTVTVVLVAAAVAVFLYFYYSQFQFRFALVPLLPDRFTVEGYYLFSLPHLVDFGNLLLLMVPALPVAMALLFIRPTKKLRTLREYRFLALLLVSCCGAVFVFDPKLGMPRDWDLFSFVGPPLGLAAIYFVLDPRVRPRSYGAVVILVIALNLLVLFPRAISQTNPDLSVTWFNNYAALDKTKNMYGRTLFEKSFLRSSRRRRRCGARDEPLRHRLSGVLAEPPGHRAQGPG